MNTENNKIFIQVNRPDNSGAETFGRVAICVPTRNAGPQFAIFLEMIKIQELPEPQLIIIDSSSTDDTVALAREAGAQVKIIPQAAFNHGATRNLAYRMIEADIYIYMTQDVLPASRHTLTDLISPFRLYPEVGVVYARQLPRSGAGPIEAYSRLFTYPAASQLKKKAGRALWGIKTVHCSNACAAYRRKALVAVGGFPDDVIMCEDVYAAARIMEAGYDIYYQADAQVYHSHDYSIWQTFKRYFDLGVFFESRERWITDAFGGTQKQGARFFLGGLSYLKAKGCAHLFPEWVGDITAKFFGYKLGSLEGYLPTSVKKSISMHKNYWLQVESGKKSSKVIS